MQLRKDFEVSRSRDDAVECTLRDDTLVGLFPDAKTEIIERSGDRRTVRSEYTALGSQGVATFHFDCLMDGSLRFHKVCDGKVWKKLEGVVSFEERGNGTRVSIELDGQTKGLVPEMAIRGPMREQIEQMATALRQRIESA